MWVQGEDRTITTMLRSQLAALAATTTAAGTDCRPPTVGALRMTRQQIYASSNAIGNLAKKTNTIRVTIEAQRADDFVSTWL